ncbi:cobalamin B12-binding domain-containing protein [Clostridium sp. AM54-14XD]|uniref:cobalamin B12-binding domain-containing protein n=1 Tax=Clostridium sp. AM54-14XD TaxID=2293037 RepID=UPI0026A3F4C7
MKFLLAALNTKYIHSNPGIYSLYSYSVKKQPSLAEYIEIAEYTINNQKGEILADIYKRRPDAVGFSCYIWNIEMIRELITELKKLLPDTDIWVGGPEVPTMPISFLRRCRSLQELWLEKERQPFMMC